MQPTMSPIQHELHVSESTLQKLAETPVRAAADINRDPVRPGIRSRKYTLHNPPPHLRNIPWELLALAYEWADGDWYLIEPIQGGVMVHNNRSMADKYRKH